MSTHSSLRKDLRKLIANTKGFSSVIGTTFMVLVMLVLATSIFLWTLSQNTEYFKSVKEENQLEVDRLNERLTAENVNYTGSGVISVEVDVRNECPLFVNLTTLWMFDVNIGKYGVNDTLNICLKPGEKLSLRGSRAIKTEINGSDASHIFNSWFVTARGNTVPITKTAGIIMAQVSEGIGSISFDFEQFWHYDFSTQPADGTPLPSKSSNNYTISANNYTVFHVVVTNLDPLGKDIVLNGNSSIYIICAQKGTVKYGTWGLVNVTANKIYPSSNAQYCLKYLNTIEIYFAGKLTQNPDLNTAYPLNVLLLGRKGNNDYGQNIPFVSIYLVS